MPHGAHVALREVPGFSVFAWTPDRFGVLALDATDAPSLQAITPLVPSKLHLTPYYAITSARTPQSLVFAELRHGDLYTWAVDDPESAAPRFRSLPSLASIVLPEGETAVDVGVFADFDEAHFYAVSRGVDESLRVRSLVAPVTDWIATGRPLVIDRYARRRRSVPLGSGRIELALVEVSALFLLTHRQVSVLASRDRELELAFTTPIVFGESAAVFDFDRDGLVELLIVNEMGHGRWVSANGSLDFEVTDFPMLVGNGELLDLQPSGDIDGDGREDVVVLWYDEGTGDASWGILVQRGSGLHVYRHGVLPSRAQLLQDFRVL